jgi:Leucine-rich repeat (LRR) protein
MFFFLAGASVAFASLHLTSLPADLNALPSDLKALKIDKLSSDELLLLAPYIDRLEVLDLSYTEVDSVSILASQCPNLRDVDLSHTRVTNVNALAQLRNLRRLNLSGCQSLTSLPNRGLSHWDWLRLLSVPVLFISLLVFLHEVRSTAVFVLVMALLALFLGLVDPDVSFPVRSDDHDSNMFPRLLKLNLAGSGILHLEGIEIMSELRILSIADTEITDIRHLSRLVHLVELTLQGAEIQDLSPLTVPDHALRPAAHFQGPRIRKIKLYDSDTVDLSPVQNLIDANLLTVKRSQHPWQKPVLK